MSSALGSFSIGLITAMGLKAAGYVVPALKPVIAGGGAVYGMLKKIDNEMELEAAQSVREANRLADGSLPFLLVLPAVSSTTQQDLQKYVDANGGTAWFQTGANRRLEAYWTESAKFAPKETQNCSLGHVVHGKQDGNYKALVRSRNR